MLVLGEERFKLNVVEHQVIAGDGFFVREGQQQFGGFGFEEDAVQILSGHVVVVFILTLLPFIDINGGFGKDFGIVQHGIQAEAARIELLCL